MGGAASAALSEKQFYSLRDLYESDLRDLDAETAVKHLRSKFADLAPAPKPSSLPSSSSSSSSSSSHDHDQDSHWSTHTLGVGDVVKVKVDALTFEGIVASVCKLEEHSVMVDFGDSEEKVDVNVCTLVLRAIDFEVDDKVECKPSGFSMYFHGHIVRNNHDGTFDVKIDSDDPDEDIERNVPHDCLRKLMTGRHLAMMKLHRAVHTVQAVNAFKSMGKFHAKAQDKLRSIKLRNNAKGAGEEEGDALSSSSSSSSSEADGLRAEAKGQGESRDDVEDKK